MNSRSISALNYHLALNCIVLYYFPNFFMFLIELGSSSRTQTHAFFFKFIVKTFLPVYLSCPLSSSYPGLCHHLKLVLPQIAVLHISLTDHSFPNFPACLFIQVLPLLLSSDLIGISSSWTFRSPAPSCLDFPLFPA